MLALNHHFTRYDKLPPTRDVTSPHPSRNKYNIIFMVKLYALMFDIYQ